MPARKENAPSLLDMLNNVADGLEQQIESIYSYTPHEKQQIFHKSDFDEKLMMGGNRLGKTKANVAECIWRLTKTHPFRPELNQIKGPVRGRFVCVSYEEGMVKIIIPYFKAMTPTKYLKGRSWEKAFSAQHRTLTFADESFIEFMSYEQNLEKFAGTSRHFIAFDEEPPKSIFMECLLRLVDTDGDWWISMTPILGMTWVYYDLYLPIKEGTRKNTLLVQGSIYDNPFLTEKAIHKVLDNITDAEEREAREHGNFVNIKGLVYKDFDPGFHNRGQYLLVPGSRIYTSLDTGWRHPAAWLWHAVEPSGHIVTFHEMVDSEKTVEYWARNVLEYEAKVLIPKGFKVYARTGDPAMLQVREGTGTNIIAEYAKRGIFIGVEGVPKGPGSVELGVNKLTQYMQTEVRGRRMWGYSNTPVLERQLRNLRWEKYESKKMDDKKPLKTTINKIEDDAPDSLRYFISLQDELTPQRVKAANQFKPLIGAEESYYDGYAPKMKPNYTVYQGSVQYNMER